ncbi:hypothetical protein K443DRAFT_330032 [Laccaria amethystina LaAM-08-1]|uniref:SWR1-complex protein 5 n=1 Tax=Laccaria amethystina LaAM-08-1 TaxID=1095629 RepID=A0A0C9WJV5_9AGAR|nr:hypothetical protein K443DRAFT_330032 [Laccaria amethystina LaAM-08-1]
MSWRAVNCQQLHENEWALDVFVPVVSALPKTIIMTQAKLNASDSEDDEDYVPPAEDAAHSSSDEDSESEEPAIPQNAPAAESEDKEKRDLNEIWSNFEASVATTREVRDEKMVKVERRYRFAGEETVEVIEVPENSEDAKRWPRWIDPEAEGFTTPLTLPDATAEGSTTPFTLPDDIAGPSTQLSATTKTPAKKPGPRKSRTTLSALPAPSKAKKISTLDKSAMDWQAHIQNEQASGIKDELEANRRSGGYLEKVEFLQRVGDRKEENLDTLRSRKRRKI